MTAQKIMIFGVGLVILSMFIFVQRQIAGATQAHFQSTPVAQSSGERSLFNLAAAAALEPEFFDRPASHSALTMAVVQSDPETMNLDQTGQIRAAFDLADKYDHNAILEKYLETASFGAGCQGASAALAGLNIGSAASETMHEIAIAALLKASETGSVSAKGIREVAQSIAETLFAQDLISAEINQEIQSASAADFIVSGGCNS